jgi:hypothetical protein
MLRDQWDSSASTALDPRQDGQDAQELEETDDSLDDEESRLEKKTTSKKKGGQRTAKQQKAPETDKKKKKIPKAPEADKKKKVSRPKAPSLDGSGLEDLKIQDVDLPDYVYLSSQSQSPQEVILVDMSSVPQVLVYLNEYSNRCVLPSTTRVWGFADVGYNGYGSKKQPCDASRIKIFYAKERKKNAADVLMIWEVCRLVVGAQPHEKFALFVVTRDQQFSYLQDQVEQAGHTLRWAQDWDQLVTLLTLNVAKESVSSSSAAGTHYSTIRTKTSL